MVEFYQAALSGRLLCLKQRHAQLQMQSRSFPPSSILVPRTSLLNMATLSP